MNATPSTLEQVTVLFHSFVGDNYSSIAVEENYDEMLNESYDLSSVGGPFAHMSASDVLKSVDPVAYRCGMVDYEDSMSRDNGIIEIEENLYHEDDVESAKDEFVAMLRREGYDEDMIEAAENIDITA